MTVIDHTDTTFTDDTYRDGITVIDFWAPWCHPCRTFAPIFTASAERNIDITHIKIDIDANPKLAAAFNIQAVPTTVLMKDGMLLGRIPGAMGATQLAQLLDQARKLDIGETAPIEHPQARAHKR